jgi:hypothetical protein
MQPRRMQIIFGETPFDGRFAHPMENDNVSSSVPRAAAGIRFESMPKD